MQFFTARTRKRSLVKFYNEIISKREQKLYQKFCVVVLLHAHCSYMNMYYRSMHNFSLNWIWRIWVKIMGFVCFIYAGSIVAVYILNFASNNKRNSIKNFFVQEKSWRNRISCNYSNEKEIYCAFVCFLAKWPKYRLSHPKKRNKWIMNVISIRSVAFWAIWNYFENLATKKQ